MIRKLVDNRNRRVEVAFMQMKKCKKQAKRGDLGEISKNLK